MTPVPDGVRRDQAIRDEPAPARGLQVMEAHALDRIDEPTRRATPWSSMLVFLPERSSNA